LSNENRPFKRLFRKGSLLFFLFSLIAARVGKWKWVDSNDGSGLFDLTQDIGEKNDLSATRPEVLQMVKQRFARWRKEMANAEPRGPFKDY